jgi:hypothetical protein
VQWILLAAVVITFCFGFVLLFGAPYVPTLDLQAGIALDMIALKRGQTLLELGSGDGKILLAAAERGWNAVGFELNPILVLISRWRTRHYRKQVRVVWGNFWDTEKWPKAEGVFVFILQKHMKKLDSKVTRWQADQKKPVKLVSFAFPIAGKTLTAQDKSGVYLYNYQ